MHLRAYLPSSPFSLDGKLRISIVALASSFGFDDEIPLLVFDLIIYHDYPDS